VIKEKKVNKPMAGHFAKQGTTPVRHLREVRVENAGEFSVGDEVTVGVFAENVKVDVTSTSKGKGFAGVMKRYNFKGGPGGHGSHFHRAPGSVGQCATPSRVFKGLRLPGHMGCETVTTKNLQVVRIDEEQNLILVKGAVPGGKNATVRVRLA
ncbi:MAG: 50S ribosomal protein L3, partial [Raoultibacter sp.]